MKKPWHLPVLWNSRFLPFKWFQAIFGNKFVHILKFLTSYTASYQFAAQISYLGVVPQDLTQPQPFFWEMHSVRPITPLSILPENIYLSRFLDRDISPKFSILVWCGKEGWRHPTSRMWDYHPFSSKKWPLSPPSLSPSGQCLVKEGLYQGHAMRHKMGFT